MGDEAHNRNNALASIVTHKKVRVVGFDCFCLFAVQLSSELVSGMLQAHVPNDKILKIMDWFSYRTWNTQSGVRGWSILLVHVLGLTLLFLAPFHFSL